VGCCSLLRPPQKKYLPPSSPALRGRGGGKRTQHENRSTASIRGGGGTARMREEKKEKKEKKRKTRNHQGSPVAKRVAFRDKKKGKKGGDHRFTGPASRALGGKKKGCAGHLPVIPVPKKKTIKKKGVGPQKGRVMNHASVNEPFSQRVPGQPGFWGKGKRGEGRKKKAHGSEAVGLNCALAAQLKRGRGGKPLSVPPRSARPEPTERKRKEGGRFALGGCRGVNCGEKEKKKNRCSPFLHFFP